MKVPSKINMQIIQSTEMRKSADKNKEKINSWELLEISLGRAYMCEFDLIFISLIKIIIAECRRIAPPLRPSEKAMRRPSRPGFSTWEPSKWSRGGKNSASPNPGPPRTKSRSRNDDRSPYEQLIHHYNRTYQL
jgi:hypothetical protein